MVILSTKNTLKSEHEASNKPQQQLLVQQHELERELLGTGPSLAALPGGDHNGKKLPVRCYCSHSLIEIILRFAHEL